MAPRNKSTITKKKSKSNLTPKKLELSLPPLPPKADVSSEVSLELPEMPDLALPELDMSLVNIKKPTAKTNSKVKSKSKIHIPKLNLHKSKEELISKPVTKSNDLSKSKLDKKTKVDKKVISFLHKDKTPKNKIVKIVKSKSMKNDKSPLEHLEESMLHLLHIDKKKINDGLKSHHKPVDKSAKNNISKNNVDDTPNLNNNDLNLLHPDEFDSEVELIKVEKEKLLEDEELLELRKIELERELSEFESERTVYENTVEVSKEIENTSSQLRVLELNVAKLEERKKTLTKTLDGLNKEIQKTKSTYDERVSNINKLEHRLLRKEADLDEREIVLLSLQKDILDERKKLDEQEFRLFLKNEVEVTDDKADEEVDKFSESLDVNLVEKKIDDEKPTLNSDEIKDIDTKLNQLKKSNKDPIKAFNKDLASSDEGKDDTSVDSNIIKSIEILDLIRETNLLLDNHQIEAVLMNYTRISSMFSRLDVSDVEKKHIHGLIVNIHNEIMIQKKSLI